MEIESNLLNLIEEERSLKKSSLKKLARLCKRLEGWIYGGVEKDYNESFQSNCDSFFKLMERGYKLVIRRESHLSREGTGSASFSFEVLREEKEIGNLFGWRAKRLYYYIRKQTQEQDNQVINNSSRV